MLVELMIMAMYMKFEDINFFNPSVYHYNLHDIQNCIITGYVHKSIKIITTT